jgi:hypothetical protein
VLCPLPSGDVGYQKFLEDVKGRLPSQDLRSATIGGHEYVTAPIKDLPLLFPIAATGSSEGVYALLHSRPAAVNIRSHRARGGAP